MKTQLINGYFSKKDALDLITHMVQLKQKFHEHKITGATTEEDIKAREKRIKDLQQNLAEIREYIAQNDQDGISIQAEIVLSVPQKV